MNLRYLRYFAGVAEHMSFSRASVHLNISQSALSRQIQLLERDLDVRLFDRIGRRIALTPAGHDLLTRCHTVLQNVDSFCTRADELATGSTGTLRVGATPQTLESVITRFLVTYREKFPKIDVALVEDGAAGLLQHLEQGTIQVAIAALTAGSQLKGKDLFPLGVLAVVPDGHPLKSRRAIEVAELASDPLLLLRKEFMTRQTFDGACQIAHISPRTVIESGSPHCLLSLVSVGLGIAIVPSTVLLGEMRANAVPLHQDGRQLGFWMSAVWDPRRHVSPPAMAFIDELHQAALHDYPGKSFQFGQLVHTAIAN
ncbi:MAG: LysR family transcriptional regulator [Methyloligellaceae bacterium]